MALFGANLLKFINRNGVPALQSSSASLTSTEETFFFQTHTYINTFFQGLVLFKITGTPTAPSTAVPVVFNSETGSDPHPVLNNKGTAYTTETWPGDGIYIALYDRVLNQLTLLND